MSKRSRAQARQGRKQSALPRGIAVVGIVAVMVVAIVAANRLTKGPRTGSDEVAAVAPAAAPASRTAQVAAPARQLLFFMNPDGYPCQTQLGILNTVADSLSKVAQVVYIKTTEPADLQKFEQYGIRGLPSLVIADRTGRELSRFSPGIQSGEAVLAALTK